MAILESNTDLDVKGRVLATTVPNSTGSIVTWNASTKVFGLRTNAQIISDLGLQSSLTQGNHINITGNVISVKPTLNTWIEDSGNNNRILMSTVSSGTNHNDMVLKQISSDGYFKLRNAQDEDFFVYKNNTQELMMPLVGTSSSTVSNILMLGSNGTLWKSNRTIGDLIQNLSNGSVAGQINISGGGTPVTLHDLSRTNLIDFNDVSSIKTGSFTTFFNTTGSTGYPNAAGQGVMSLRRGTTQGSFALWVNNSDSDGKLYLNIGSSTGWQGWESIASREWVTQQTGNLPSLTTTDKSNLVDAINEVNGNIPTDVGIRKTIRRNVSGSYRRTVIPLVLLDNTSISRDSYFFGEVHAKRNNALDGLLFTAKISAGKLYNSETPVVNITYGKDYGGITFKPVTFTYNGLKYFGIDLGSTGANFTHATIDGISDDWSYISVINYLDTQNNIVLNQEISDSITDYVYFSDDTNKIEKSLNKIESEAFIKNGGNGSNILLDDGNVKAVSDFALAGSLGSYLPLAGGTMVNASTINWDFIGRLSIGGNYRLRFDSVNTFLSANNGTIYLRPQGDSITTNQITIDSNGQINTDNHGNSSQWKQAYDWGNYGVHGLGQTSINNGVYSSIDYTNLLTGGASAHPTSFVMANGSSGLGQPTGFAYSTGIHWNISAAVRMDLVISHYANRMAFRSGGRDWSEVYHTDNFNPAQYVLQSSLNTQLANYVPINGVITINNTKTFTSSPIVPNATLNSHAVNLGQLNSAISGIATPTLQQVLTAGNTATNVNSLILESSGSNNYSIINQYRIATTGGWARNGFNHIIRNNADTETISNLRIQAYGSGENLTHHSIGTGTYNSGSTIRFYPNESLRIYLDNSERFRLTDTQVRFSVLNTAGFVKTDNNGFLSVDTNTYALASSIITPNNGLLTISTSSDLTGGGTFSADQATASNVNIGLSAGTLASLALANTALQSGDNVSELNNDVGYITASSLPNVGNGNITYSGIGDITGGGTSTANQSGNTDYTFDLTAQTKSNIALGVTANSWGNHAGKYVGIHPSYSTNMPGTNIDFDNISGAGMFRIGTNSTNTPDGTSSKTWILLNMYGSSSENAQLAIAVGGTGYPNSMYIRQRQNRPWSELTTSTNLNAQATALGFIKSSALPTVNDGQLTLTTGTGLSGSANFTANQSGNSSFSVGIASTHKLPTVAEWNALPTTNTTYTGSNGIDLVGTDFRLSSSTISDIQLGVTANSLVINGGISRTSQVLNNTNDLDLIITPGYYHHSSGSAPLNTPTSGAGYLEVVDAGSNAFMRQTWRARGSRLEYQRTRNSAGVWSDWVVYYNSDNFNPSDYATVAQLSGYVPTSRTLTINGTTFDLSQNRTWNIPDNDTITRLRGTTSGTYTSGDLTLLAGTNVSIVQSGSDFTINATNTNTTYTAGTGLSLTGTTFGQTITTSGTGSFVTGITQTTNGFQVNLGTPPNTTSNLALGTRTATTMPITNSGGTGVTLPIATTALAGLLSGADKTKLDGIATGANNYVHPNSGVTAGTYNQVTVDAQGHVTAGNNQPYQTNTQVNNAINNAIQPLVDGVDYHHLNTGGHVPIEKKKTIVNIPAGSLGYTINVDDAPYEGYELAINGCGEWSVTVNGSIMDKCGNTDSITLGGNQGTLFWWSVDLGMWIQAI